MSIYSGFATRQQEHKYNSLLETLVIALKKRLIKFYNQEECDQPKFKLLLKKIYKKMYLLERGKFMSPKYSSCLTDFIQALNIDINYDAISECSSLPSNITFHKTGGHEPEELQSRNALQLKINQLETKEKQPRQMSALSVPRNRKYVHFSPENAEGESTSRKMAESMFQTAEEFKVKKRFRGALVDLKELRGTAHMPKLQNFAPKRSQIFPKSSRHSQKVLKKSQQSVDQDGVPQTFRRQKYTKHSLKVQNI